MIFLSQNLAQDCQTKEAPDKFSMELLWTKIRFVASIQENMSRYNKRMNPGTKLIYIYIEQLEQLF